MLDEKNISYLLYDDYAQSANSLFHFMTKANYLKSALSNKALIPRYCVEDIGYLGIKRDGHQFSEIAVLQKCFCDIPFHKLGENLQLKVVEEEYDKLTLDNQIKLKNHNTHFDYYGKYAIAFSKSWGEKKGLQPIHYLNTESPYANDFSSLFESIFAEEELTVEYSRDIIDRLAYLKPLRGSMKRKIKDENMQDVDIEIENNFHDEREWRYVPNTEQLDKCKLECIIAHPLIVKNSKAISQALEESKYEQVWLKFMYNEIRYIIVPDQHARLEFIDVIMSLPEDNFDGQDNVLQQKYILISKILVLDEIRKDW